MIGERLVTLMMKVRTIQADTFSFFSLSLATHNGQFPKKIKCNSTKILLFSFCAFLIFLNLYHQQGRIQEKIVIASLIHPPNNKEKKVIDFSTIPIYGKSCLSWTVCNYTDKSVCLIERSKNGKTFETIGMKKGAEIKESKVNAQDAGTSS